ncbi:dolichyl-P-Glc:Glc1Man(9)GlcNAc(2)-PP-dolichol alpha-1,3-glucosyltransferase [Sporobolomyces koalae]|uniref:dolichyl-P-Glc:Glc1Man(9)GlcNAc(2)-PP-dolichol alpha-1,3-glucosyltransferase n=1 Tax=Sporobolomyces koalae TaxID=500713 RepID=UPI0031765D64
MSRQRDRPVAADSVRTKVELDREHERDHRACRSTDFEVHRNWLAITHTLPLREWYHDTTSEWTLDYPPFFAFFERILSTFAYIVDPEIVRLDNLRYDAPTAIAFQRTTVIVSELVLVFAVFRWARKTRKPDPKTAFAIAASLLFHPGLIMVDHIHFQYNGFLLGILLWSLIAAQENKLYLCAALFATLLNLKHIFIYIAPPFVVYLFRAHCCPPKGRFQLDRLIELGLIVGTVCALSFGPFVLAGGPSQIQQIVSRLFPFQRGLNHAYWAGNAWALVSAADRVLVKYLVARGVPIATEALTSSSRGLIGSTTFGVLPNVTPTMTFAITFFFISIYLVKLWYNPTTKKFIDAVVLSAMTSFLWGWHVHEKAVLLFLIPLSLTSVEDDNHLRAFRIATVAGVCGLFPLLINSAETPVKLIVSGIWFTLVFPQLRRVVYRPLPSFTSMVVNKLETIYLFGFVVLQIYVSILHDSLFPRLTTISCDQTESLELCSSEHRQSSSIDSASFEFLPLMITSVYCAMGIGWSWIRLSWGFLVQ